MDNERQVKFQPEELEGALVAARAKDWFLQVVRDFAKSQERYNLDLEFSKTKKARTPLVLLTVIATVAVFGGGAFWFTQVYSQERNKVEVSSSEFENVDLRDLLDQFRKLDSERLFHEDKLRQLERAQEDALERARSLTADKITFEMGKNLLADEEARRVKNLELSLGRELAKIKADRAAEQDQVRGVIDNLNQQIAAIDQEKLGRALSLEVVLSADRKLFDQEMNRTRTLYEEEIAGMEAAQAQAQREREIFVRSLERQARELLASEKARLVSLYNPVFSAPEEQALLSRTVDGVGLERFKARVPESVHAGAVVDRSDIEAVDGELREIRALYRLASRTPYINDVPPLLRQLLARSLATADAALAPAGKLGTEVLRLSGELDKEKAQKRALETDLGNARTQVERLTGSLDSLRGVYAGAAAKVGQSALVMWVESPELVRAYIDPTLMGAEGQRFYVTRKDTIPLGEYEIQAIDGSFALLRKVDLPPDLQSRLGRLDQKLRVIIPGDWLVSKDTYKLPGTK